MEIILGSALGGLGFGHGIVLLRERKLLPGILLLIIGAGTGWLYYDLLDMLIVLHQALPSHARWLPRPAMLAGAFLAGVLLIFPARASWRRLAPQIERLRRPG